MSMDQEFVQLRGSLDAHIQRLEEGHRMHRKIQFLLDIRGLLVINHLEGDYAEFGVYRGEMMYCARRILGNRIGRYVGLDTFEGLPQPRGEDADTFVFESPGFMASPKSVAEAFLDGVPHELIQGDFRDAEVGERFQAACGTLSVLSVDCNWPSSVEVALRLAAPKLQCGTIVYMDDWFVGTRKPNFNVPLFQALEREHGLKLVEFKTYAPCARAFVVETP
jgi:hypothetical protein